MAWTPRGHTVHWCRECHERGVTTGMLHAGEIPARFVEVFGVMQTQREAELKEAELNTRIAQMQDGEARLARMQAQREAELAAVRQAELKEERDQAHAEALLIEGELDQLRRGHLDPPVEITPAGPDESPWAVSSYSKLNYHGREWWSARDAYVQKGQRADLERMMHYVTADAPPLASDMPVPKRTGKQVMVTAVTSNRQARATAAVALLIVVLVLATAIYTLIP